MAVRMLMEEIIYSLMTTELELEMCMYEESNVNNRTGWMYTDLEYISMLLDVIYARPRQWRMQDGDKGG
jgi:hypothetical protein